MRIKEIIPWRRKKVEVSHDLEHPITYIQREMNRLFDEFLKGFDFELPDVFRGHRFSPLINVSESDKDITVTAELPGMDENDVEVILHEDALEIKGEKKIEHEEKDKDYYRMERSYGKFSRVIPLPVEIDTEKVEATFDKGVLKVVLPKVEKETSKSKKIEIKKG